MSRRSRRAVGRSAVGERTVISLLGLLLVAGGVIALLVGFEVLGTPRAQRPVLDPLAVQTLRAYPLASRIVAIAVGLLLLLLGLLWAFRSLRPERRPDLLLEADDDSSVRVTSSAATGAVTADAEQLAGVGRAKARLVGTAAHPALRLTLWLTDGADVRDVWREVEDTVLSRARRALGVDTLPTAIRLELDSSSGKSRVS